MILDKSMIIFIVTGNNNMRHNNNNNNNLCLHFSENGYAKCNGDFRAVEHTAVTINENIPGK
jgi:hypothetical protein